MWQWASSVYWRGFDVTRVYPNIDPNFLRFFEFLWICLCFNPIISIFIPRPIVSKSEHKKSLASIGMQGIAETKRVPPLGGTLWWRRVDSNHRSESQQIYSLPPLATRELLHLSLELVDGLEPPTC